MRSFWPLFGVVLVLAAVLAGCSAPAPGGCTTRVGPGGCAVSDTDSAGGGGGM